MQCLKATIYSILDMYFIFFFLLYMVKHFCWYFCVIAADQSLEGFFFFFYSWEAHYELKEVWIFLDVFEKKNKSGCK